MPYAEHNPPHFHARYGQFSAAIGIDPLDVLEGKLPPRALGLVVEWASQHKKELMINWEKARNDKPLKKIRPLQ
jgi:hypothetical protein